jgi:hypothetical protein
MVSLFEQLTQLLEFFKQLNVATCSRSTLYTLQSEYVNPTVYSYWLREQAQLFNTIRESGEPVCISSDGQYDSPGHNATYCFER